MDSQRRYHQFVERVHAAGSRGSARVHTIGSVVSGGKNYPLLEVSIGNPGPDRLRVTISAGIHGDEPAGSEAAIQFISESAVDTALLSRFHFTVFPCDNPTGWELGTRENAEGVDLNRQFNVAHPPPEVVIIENALKGRCFDLVFEMHEDIDSPGFYMYELVEDPCDAVAPRIVAEVSAAGYPINTDRTIEGRRASGGVISPTIKRFRKTRLPKAIYTYRTCGGHVMTLEPPASVLPVEDRVKILLMSLRIALESAAHSTRA